MSGLNENLIVDPRHRSQRITLASSASALKRGQVIGYTNSSGTISFEALSADNSAYGILLEDLPALSSAAERSANVLVEGEVNGSAILGVSEAAVTAAQKVALRCVGIICK